ncbi:MAG: MFS transporter [Jatrophihabitantaceae bacterium]
MKTVNTTLARNGVWWRWSAAVGCARLPPAMAPLASIFAGRELTGSYAFGALLAGAYALCESLGAPWRGRALDRCPPALRGVRMRRSLLVSGASLAGLAVTVWTHQHPLALVVLTALAAFSASGVPGGYRALLTELVEPAQVLPALSWDATLLEVEWLIGPVLVAVALASGQPAVAYLIMACWAFSGALLTAIVPIGTARPAKARADLTPVDLAPVELAPVDLAPVGGDRPAAAVAAPSGTQPAVEPAGPAVEHGGAWRHPAGWPSYLTSSALGTAEGGFVAALPALLLTLHASAAAAGLFAALLALASMLGGVGLSVLQARLGPEPGTLADWALLLMCALLLPAVLVPSAAWLVLPVLAGGLFVAPVNALRSKALEQALPASLRGEGFSIQYGANGVGTALGSALIAALVTHSVGLAVVMVLVIPALMSAGSLLLSGRVGVSSS